MVPWPVQKTAPSVASAVNFIDHASLKRVPDHSLPCYNLKTACGGVLAVLDSAGDRNGALGLRVRVEGAAPRGDALGDALGEASSGTLTIGGRGRGRLKLLVSY